jgi:hypothetical protein
MEGYLLQPVLLLALVGEAGLVVLVLREVVLVAATVAQERQTLLQGHL